MHARPDIEALTARHSTIPAATIRDFVMRMDEEYFSEYSDAVVSTHLDMINGLTLETPCAIRIQALERRIYQLTFVAYDYFSEFATFCGLLSSYGLDIRDATIFTYTKDAVANPTDRARSSRAAYGRRWRSAPSTGSAGLSRKKVVDTFRVHLLPGCTFEKQVQARFKDSVLEMLGLLERGHVRQVRRAVNRALIERLGHMRSKVPDFVHPVDISFDNATERESTLMTIRSTDTPAFLYTFANALTMRGVYVAKARIEVEGTSVCNRFYVRGRSGAKIHGTREQQELSSAAALIKEFSHYLRFAPDPGQALEHFDQLLDDLHGEDADASAMSLLTTTKPLLGQLATLFGSSDFLWEDLLRRQHTNLLPAMATFQKGPLIRSAADLSRSLAARMKGCKTTERRKKCLNDFKDEELFRIDMKHLLDATPLPDFSRALTNLADVVLAQALNEAERAIGLSPRRAGTHAAPYEFAIMGLGKLGGRELGYASDIEVLFVYRVPHGRGARAAKAPSADVFEALVQEFLRWIDAKAEGVFHIDTRLRPYGEKGLLANSFEELQRYYSPSGSAAPFERQALIKLRHVAGHAALGKQIEALRDAFVYSLASWPIETALHLRQRQIQELVPPKTIHVKYSPGGLIDIEYLTQYLQLVHGHAHTALHTTNTLEGLTALHGRRLLIANDLAILSDDYVFFRQLIDALRIVRGNAQDLVLPEPTSDSMMFLARRMGVMKKHWKDAAASLDRDIRRRMGRTHAIFAKHLKSLNADA